MTLLIPHDAYRAGLWMMHMDCWDSGVTICVLVALSRLLQKDLINTRALTVVFVPEHRMTCNSDKYIFRSLFFPYCRENSNLWSTKILWVWANSSYNIIALATCKPYWSSMSLLNSVFCSYIISHSSRLNSTRQASTMDDWFVGSLH